MAIRKARTSGKKNKSKNPKKYVDLGNQYGEYSEDTEERRGVVVDNFYRDWCKENGINPDTASRAQYLDAVALTSTFRAKAEEILSDEEYEAIMEAAEAETFPEASDNGNDANDEEE